MTLLILFQVKHVSTVVLRRSGMSNFDDGKGHENRSCLSEGLIIRVAKHVTDFEIEELYIFTYFIFYKATFCKQLFSS